MRFSVSGPFTLPRHGAKKLITEQTLRDLKDSLSDQEGLATACGCYVFALRAGKGYTPHYVGQSCRRTILFEALNPINRERYNKVLDSKKGTPVLFFIPLLTPSGKFRKPRKADGSLASVDFLERWLISQAIQKNPHLTNNKETRFLRDLHVVGIFNPRRGESTKETAALAKALWR